NRNVVVAIQARRNSGTRENLASRSDREVPRVVFRRPEPGFDRVREPDGFRRTAERLARVAQAETTELDRRRRVRQPAAQRTTGARRGDGAFARTKVGGAGSEADLHR